MLHFLAAISDLLLLLLLLLYNQPATHPLCFFLDDNNAGDEPSHSDDDGNGKPSTSAATGTMMTSPSPPSTSHAHDLPGKTPAIMEPVERFQRKSVIAFASAWEWESLVAADISRITSLVVELDLSASPRDDWRGLVGGGGGQEETRQVARSIEAMIFEEVRWDAVRDMLSLRQH